MINILLNLYNFDEKWCFDIFKNVIKPKHKVLIVPFSYHEDWLKNENDWEQAFNFRTGTHYREIIEPFLSYGILEDNINWINQFKDSKCCAKEKVRNSDIIFFTGGYPDKMMDRIKAFDLIEILENHEGIMMGSSAGAMIQISEYHITKDKDYDEFSYKKGLNIIKDFDIEVHYENSDIQNISINRCLKERGKTIYSMENQGGIMVLNGVVTLLGEVRKWSYN